MDEAELKSEAAKFDALTTDELFMLVIPPDAQLEAYSRGALLAKGKEIFNRVWMLARDPVCKAYRQNL